MITNNNVLIAEEGKWLTNGETFGTTITLGRLDHPDNWWEVTAEEKEQIEAEQGGDINEP